jgi:hypothetical protein
MLIGPLKKNVTLLHPCVASLVPPRLGTTHFQKFFIYIQYVLLNSHKSTNKMQKFHKFITLRLCVAQHVFGRFHAHNQELTTALATSGFTVGAWW